MNISLIANEANIKNRVGSNQYAFELIKALYQQDRKNQYTLFLSQPALSNLPKPRKNWRYQIVKPARFANFLALPWALSQQKPKPDVVFNPGHYAPIFYPAPLVISIMDLGFLRFPQQFTLPILAKLKFWTKFSSQHASHILAISQATKKDIVQYYGLPASKITVTYPGHNKRKFAIRHSQFIIKNDYILFLSTLKPNKNIEGLLEAFERLRHPGGARPMKLVIAGRKGWLYQSVFSKVKQLGLEKKVIFTGFVPEKDVSGLIKNAKVFVMPSFWEGFGIPVVEAMALGTPVVVSDRGSLPEIVGKAGVIVNPNKPVDIAEGITQAIKNYDKLSKAGVKQAKKFNWQTCAKQTLKVLENVAKNH